MVSTALFLIVQAHPTPWMAFWAAVIVGREIAVSALREWMAELGQRAAVKVAAIGKIKTIAQMVALLCLLLRSLQLTLLPSYFWGHCFYYTGVHIPGDSEGFLEFP